MRSVSLRIAISSSDSLPLAGDRPESLACPVSSVCLGFGPPYGGEHLNNLQRSYRSITSIQFKGRFGKFNI